MTKTERWYSIVEELRAAAPRPRSARWLAERFGVSRRTIERDLDGLLQAGAPLYAETGRTGGWILDRTATFAPPALDAAEVTALAVAVAGLAGTPFADASRRAMNTIRGTLPAVTGGAVGERAAQIALVRDGQPPDAAPRAVQRALDTHRVLRLDYTDAGGTTTVRDVEPLGFLGAEHWYLVAWCRLRDGVRGFRRDRIRAAAVLDESPPSRSVDLTAVAPGHAVELLENSDSTVSPAR